MNRKPTDEELEARVKELEEKLQITEQMVEAQKIELDAQQQMNKLLRSIADNVPDLIWAKDIEGRYIFTNQAICEKLLMCMAPDEAIGKTDLYFAERERRVGHQLTFGEVCMNSDDVTKEKKAPGRFLEDGLIRGNYLVLDVHKAPFLNEHGEMIGTVGCGRDVTKEKQIENALQNSEQRYALATTAGQVGVWDWNVETGDIFVDPNLKAMLGYEDHEIRNHLDDWGRVVHPDDRKAVMEEADKHFKGITEQYEVAHRMIHKDGSSRWFLARGTAIRDENGEPYRVVGTDTDITQIVLAEEALRKANDELEQHVKERTAEISMMNEELETKSIYLEETNVALNILLKKRDEDKVELEEKVLLNAKEMIEPFIFKLKKSRLDKRQTAIVDILESNIKDIVSSFTYRLESKFYNLTPAEIHVANLVKQGKTSKEIAELLGLSNRTICFHRENIRKKLGLKNQKINLTSHLMSYQ